MTKTCLSILLVLSAVPSLAQTSYQQIGNTIFSSDGTSYQSIGNTTFGSDGSSYQHIGNTTFGNDGHSYQQIGDMTFGSDGSSAQRIGNTTFINDGRGNTQSCQQIGSTTFCNRPIERGSRWIAIIGHPFGVNLAIAVLTVLLCADLAHGNRFASFPGLGAGQGLRSQHLRALRQGAMSEQT